MPKCEVKFSIYTFIKKFLYFLPLSKIKRLIFFYKKDGIPLHAMVPWKKNCWSFFSSAATIGFHGSLKSFLAHPCESTKLRD